MGRSDEGVVKDKKRNERPTMKGAKRSEGLGIFAAIAFAVGNMVGAGVFVLSGILIDLAGPSAVLSYLICGVLVAFSGLSYAALASIFPEDGGGYLYARRMLGEYLGFLAGWSMYISQIVVTSFVLLGLGIYLNLLVGAKFDPRLGALAGIILLTALNLRGLSEAGKAEIALVVTKVSILVLLAVFGMMQITRADFAPFFAHGPKGVLTGMTSVFFAYIGFQVVAMMGGRGEGGEQERSSGHPGLHRHCGRHLHRGGGGPPLCQTAQLREPERL
jgi:APA family basic amino acid/polyamine antiporter